MKVVGIIPARLESTRLPRKLLLSDTGHPLIWHTWERAQQARSLKDVIVATDSEEIAGVVRGFGGRCELTGDHPSGTDRIAEVVRRLEIAPDIIVNIQGDEPEIDPASIDAVVETLVNTETARMATLATPIRELADVQNPSCTKVARARDGRALYFSRAPIPCVRDQDPSAVLRLESPWLLHVGIYAYQREFLLKLTTLPPSRLERFEKLEQLRALEAGATIQVRIVDRHSVGIDTPDDYARFVERALSSAGSAVRNAG